MELNMELDVGLRDEMERNGAGFEGSYHLELDFGTTKHHDLSRKMLIMIEKKHPQRL